MVISSGIHEFSNLENLKIAIENDLEEFNISSNRFPVRFIFLNSFDELQRVVELLMNNAEKVELSSLLYSENSWFSNEELIRKLKKIKDNSVIVPFSEYLRFLDELKFRQVLTALTEFEDNNLKLYIPLVGLWERFEDEFWRDFHRKTDWAPIWKLKTEPYLINIFQVDFDFNDKFILGNFHLVSNTKEWFDLWKKNNIQNVISLAKPLSIYLDVLPDKTFNKYDIKTPKEYLSKICGVDINIVYKNEEINYWNNLVSDVINIDKRNISLKDIFVEKFNIHSINSLNLEDYMELYLDNSSNYYGKWIIKNVFLDLNNFKNSYLYECFNDINNLTDDNLAKNIFLKIFDFDYSKKYLDERRFLLKFFDNYDFSILSKEFNQYYNSIADLEWNKQFNYLTNNSTIEKLKIIEIIKDISIDNLLPDLKRIFPELYHYLDWNLLLDEDIPHWIFEYFKEYNKSKLFNKKSDNLDLLLSENNNPDTFYKWYYSLSSVPYLELDDDNYIIWIDGLGAEWLPLLYYFLNKFNNNYKKIVYKSIKKVNLPTTTKFNKRINNKKINDLDKYLHDNHYEYPTSLFEEIEIIKNCAKEISKIDFPKISIVSDHGFSCLCTKQFGACKRYNFENSNHEGRYFSVLNNDFNDNEDYLCIEGDTINNNNNFIVALRHVSLFNVPSHEVHGGATPEEVLVPFIVIEQDSGVSPKYKIHSLCSEINVSLNRELPIKITPEPDINKIIATYHGEKLPITKVDENYIIHLNLNFNKGNEKIILKIDNEEKELEIHIKKGGMEEEEYDFG